MLAATLFGGIPYLALKGPRPDGPTLMLVDGITAKEGYDPKPPTGLVEQAITLAGIEGAQLVILQGAGEAGQPVDPVPIKAEREAGEAEHDPVAIRRDVTTLVTGAMTEAAATPVTGPGRHLIGLLRAMSVSRGKGTNTAYLRTFGLSTEDPADCRKLMAVDPSQAVQSIAASIPDLTGFDVHLELLPPAGGQPALNGRTADWRKAFVEGLLKAAHANVRSTREVLKQLPARPAAPDAPVVPLLPERTPPPPPPPPDRDRPLTTALDSSATFVPDQAVLEDGEQAVVAQLRPIIDGVRQGRYGRVTVVGRTARIGPADTARTLSRERAQLIAGLLRAHGVPVAAADVSGLGHDRPLPPSPTDKANRSVTVTAYPLK